MKIANALNEAAVSNGDMKKTMDIFIPAGGKISCILNNSRINYEVRIAFISDRFNPMPWDNAAKKGCRGIPEGSPTEYNCISFIDALAGPNAGRPLDLSGSGQNGLFGQLIVSKLGQQIYVSWLEE